LASRALGTVSLEVVGRVALITIDNAPVNSLHPRVAADLDRALDEIEADSEVRCVVLTGAGKMFGAGGDIDYFQTLTDPEAEPYVLSIQAMQERICLLRQPVIAAINGHALGGGLELALACDIRIADEEARLGFPEVGLGIIPAAGGTQRIQHLVAPGLARRLVFTAEPLGAADAQRAGPVDAVVPHGQAVAAASALAEKIASNAPLAVAAAKRAMTLGAGLPVAEGQRLEATLFRSLVQTQDFKEGIKAFLEKRAPEYRGV
jgi:enoyl-CoA hydratase